MLRVQCMALLLIAMIVCSAARPTMEEDETERILSELLQDIYPEHEIQTVINVRGTRNAKRYSNDKWQQLGPIWG